MKSSGKEWMAPGQEEKGIQSHKATSWHFFRVIKLLSQYHSESTEKEHRWKGLIHLIFSGKVIGNNGMTEWSSDFQIPNKASYPKATLPSS